MGCRTRSLIEGYILEEDFDIEGLVEGITEDGTSDSLCCLFNAGAQGAFGDCCWFISCAGLCQYIDWGCAEAYQHCKKHTTALKLTSL